MKRPDVDDLLCGVIRLTEEELKEFQERFEQWYNFMGQDRKRNPEPPPKRRKSL